VPSPLAKSVDRTVMPPARACPPKFADVEVSYSTRVVNKVDPAWYVTTILSVGRPVRLATISVIRLM